MLLYLLRISFRLESTIFYNMVLKLEVWGGSRMGQDSVQVVFVVVIDLDPSILSNNSNNW